MATKYTARQLKAGDHLITINENSFCSTSLLVFGVLMILTVLIILISS